MNPLSFGVGPLWRRHLQRRKQMVALGHVAEYRRRLAYQRIAQLIVSVRAEYPKADEDRQQNEAARSRFQTELRELHQQDRLVAAVLDEEPSWQG